MHEVRREAKHIRYSREHFAKVETMRAKTETAMSGGSTQLALPGNQVKTDEEEEEEFQKALDEFNGDVGKLLKSLDLDSSEGDDISAFDSNLMLDSEEAVFDQDFNPEQMSELLQQLEAEEPDKVDEEEFAPLPSFNLKKGSKRVNGDVTNQLVQLLDGGDGKSPSDSLAVSKDDLLSDEKIDALWDMVEFGAK